MEYYADVKKKNEEVLHREISTNVYWLKKSNLQKIKKSHFRNIYLNTFMFFSY